MTRASPTQATSRLVTLSGVVIMVAALYFAREVLIPLALAVLVSFLLGPLVNRVQRLGVGRAPAVLMIVVLASAVVAIVGYVTALQVLDFASNLPEYRQNIRDKLQTLRVASDNVFGRATENIRQLTSDVVDATSATQPDKGTAPGAEPRGTPPASQPSEENPLPVTIQEPPLQGGAMVTQTLGMLLQPLLAAGIVLVFVIFMLIQREQLRDRVLRLIGVGRLTVTTQAMDDASYRVSRYLLSQLIVNVLYGVPLGVGLLLLGVPNASLWGILAIVLRFIPYLGPWIAAAMPIMLSLAVFDGWTTPLMVIGLFVVLELVSNNLVEPLLYGSRTGLSAIAVLISAVFWTWLWGGVGLVLATPLTVCIVVIGRYVPQWEFLSVLLSDEPGLSIDARLYQRLLAMDEDEAIDLVNERLKTHSRTQVFEEVLLPALAMAARDRHRGLVEDDRYEFVLHGFKEMIEEVGEQAMKSAQPDPSEAASAGRRTPESRRLLCLPARDELDEVAAMMLAQSMSDQGVEVEAVSPAVLAAEMLDLVEDRRPDVVCISAMPPLAVRHARYLCKRVRARFPSLKIVICLWSDAGAAKAMERLRTCGADCVATSITQALEMLRS